MSCPYYWWNNHYACRKSGKDVNEDTYDKYCKNYNYDNCPIYKQTDSSGGCYLTTACVEVKGLSDDCRELTLLRNFRDTYMRSTEQGRADICEYYHTAPEIVERIKSLADASEIFNKIYSELVVPCVAFIDAGEFEKTYITYKEYTVALKQKYLAEG